MTEKSKARDQVYSHADWQKKITAVWSHKWPDVNKHIDIYKPLRNSTIEDFKKLYEKYNKNIYLNYEQPPCSA